MRRIAFFTLWLFVFTIPWQNCLSLEAVGTVSQLAGIVAFLVAMFHCLSAGRLRRPGRILLLMGIFASYALLSAGWSLDPDATVSKAATIAQLVAMFWIISELVADDNDAQNLLAAYVAGSTVNVIAAFAQFASGNAGQDLRYAAAGFNPNDDAITLALAIPMSCFLLARARTLRAKALFVAFLTMAPMAIALTGSRTGVLAGCVAFAVSSLGMYRMRWSRRVMLVVALAVCVWCLASLVPETSWARISTISQQVDSGDLNQRTAIWAAGLKEYAGHPLLGVGEGAYQQVSGRYLGEAFVAHNTFVSVLVELGIIGFLLFSAILISAARSLWRLDGQDRLMWAAIAVTWFVGVMASTWETQKPTWFLIALVSTASRVRFEQNSTNEALDMGYEFSS